MSERRNRRPAATLIVTCEHASARVPARYRALFRGAADVLASHRGSDLGALAIARRFARAQGVSVLATRTTRLLADANRSRHHRGLFSAFSKALDPAEREALLALDWAPHRERVRAAVAQALTRGQRVVHVSIHSFTPFWDGVERNVDLGWLYDPRRAAERSLVDAWIAGVHERAPSWRLRRNAPYRGTADGLTTALRREHPGSRYAGIEIEVNQAWSTTPRARAVADHLAVALAAVLARLRR